MISYKLASCCLILALTAVTHGVRVDLSLSAKDLPSTDIFDGPPDPYCVVYYAASASDQYQKIGETQYFDNVWEYVWPEVFTFDYVAGSQQRIKIDVMDYDWDEDDQIGIVEFLLSDVVNTFGNVLDRPILGQFNKGILTIKGKVGGVVAAEVPTIESELKAAAPLVHQLKREDVQVPGNKA